MPRFYCPLPLAPDAVLDLPAGAARHVQVLRMQPGQSMVLFNGEGGSWQAEITAMTRSGVQVRVGGADAHDSTERELATPIHIAISLPANERMDWLVEKATELGAASITPLMSSRSVLRLSTAAGDARAEKKTRPLAGHCPRRGGTMWTQPPAHHRCSTRFGRVVKAAPKLRGGFCFKPS